MKDFRYRWHPRKRKDKALLAANRIVRGIVGAPSHVPVFVDDERPGLAPVLVGERAYYDMNEHAHYASTLCVDVGRDVFAGILEEAKRR